MASRDATTTPHMGAGTTTKRPSRRIPRWDTMRFALMVLVIAGHFLQQLNGFAQGTVDAATVQIAMIYSFHMPAYFLISGMLARGTMSRDRFPGKKIFAYLACGLLAEFLQRATEAAFGNPFEFHLIHSCDISWFMTALIVHTTLTWFLRDADRRLLLGFALGVGCLIGFDQNAGDFFSISLVLTNYPFFVLGTLIDPDALDQKLASLRWSRIAGLAWFVVLGVVMALRVDVTFMVNEVFLWQNNPFTDTSLVPLLWRIVVYAAGFCGCLAFAALMPSGDVPVVATLAKRTMAPYSLHWPVLLAAIYTGVFWNVPNAIGMPLSMVACWVVGIVLTFFFSLWPFWLLVAKISGVAPGERLR